MTSFFSLARELCNEILNYYTARDGKFIYDLQTRRLLTSEGYSIDIALIRTWKQVLCMGGRLATQDTFTHILKLLIHHRS
jgi:hypothetical protein